MIPGSLAFGTYFPTRSQVMGLCKVCVSPGNCGGHAFPGLQTARALSAPSVGWFCHRRLFRERTSGLSWLGGLAPSGTYMLGWALGQGRLRGTTRIGTTAPCLI